MFIGVVIGVIGKTILHQEIVKAIGALISIAGIFVTAFPYISPAPRRKQQPPVSTRSEVQTPAPPIKSLPEDRDIDSIPSITDRTTDLLTNTPVTKPKERGES